MCERVCMDRKNEIDFRFQLVVCYCMLSHLGFIYLYLLVQTFQNTRLCSSRTIRVIHCCFALLSFLYQTLHAIVFTLLGRYFFLFEVP